MSNNNLVQQTLDDLYYIYLQLDSVGVLDALFPNKQVFFEGTISKLNYSFLKFLDSNPELEESCKTSLKIKFTEKKYTSIYDVYHDIKLACITKILEYENKPNLYSKTDNFYKISTELLLREAVKLGVVLKNIPTPPQSDTEEADKADKKEDEAQIRRSQRNIERRENGDLKVETSNRSQTSSHNTSTDLVEDLIPNLEKDFDVITSCFYSHTGQAISIFAGENIPFFSSLNNVKSDLDDREPIIDANLGATILNVIPNIPVPCDEKLIKFTSETKVPNIKQILENYMHPNWLRLISSQWLKHGDDISSLHSSFAPTYDETQSIISNDWKGLTWCQQIGFKKLVDAKENYEKLLNNQKDNNDSVKNETIINVEDSKDIVKKYEEIKSEETDNDKKKDDEINSASDSKKLDDFEKILDDNYLLNEDKSLKDKIDLQNILEWDANKLIAEDEAEIVKSGKVQSSVSDMISELSELRQNRIQRQKKLIRINKNVINNSANMIAKPSNKEIKLYHKIRRLLTGLIENKDIKPSELNIDIDTRLPVLQHSYQGVLPASFAVSGQKSKTKRRR